MPRPEHGARPTGTVVTRSFLSGSIREILFFALFEIQTLSGLIPTQSGLPGIDIFSVIGKEAIGRCTDLRSTILSALVKMPSPPSPNRTPDGPRDGRCLQEPSP